MPHLQSYTVETLLLKIQSVLRAASVLSYVSDDAIVISSIGDKEVIPQFQTYLIRILTPDTAFLEKVPKLGKYYRNHYTVAIELWIKSSLKLADRLLSGNIKVNKGIYEFFQDVSDTLEHNTFDGSLDPYPGSSISQPVTLSSEEKTVEGIGFLWYGNQDNIK